MIHLNYNTNIFIFTKSFSIIFTNVKMLLYYIILVLLNLISCLKYAYSLRFKIFKIFYNLIFYNLF